MTSLLMLMYMVGYHIISSLLNSRYYSDPLISCVCTCVCVSSLSNDERTVTPAKEISDCDTA